jgi:hypothetical protein
VEAQFRSCLLRFTLEIFASRLLSKNVKIIISKNVILPLVLYGCETWCLTLRQEYRLKVFENMVLRRIFGQKMDRRLEKTA